jgi:3-oxoacyl-[acyl-carrier-protein] synthase-1
MTKKVLITGYGIISGIGCGEQETYNSLLNKRSSIGAVSYLKTALNNYPVAEIKKSNEELAQIAGLPSEKYSRSFLLGLIAAKQAVSMAGCEDEISGMGILGATTVGGMDLNEQYYKELLNGETQDLSVIRSLECADCTERIAEYFGISSNVTTMSTACSSSANTIMTGARMIKNGIAERVLVGGMDALSRFSLNGFNSLEILSPTGCKPFDRDRNGVTIGEGAAFLVLESEKSAEGKTVYGQVSGYANRNEAFHQTASSPDGAGAKMTIEKALGSANLLPENIDYINAHGTGTQVNDLSEGNAIQSVFSKNVPFVSSTKGYTGHTLAAAGSIEAVISLLSIKHQLVFPNIRMENPMEEFSFVPEKEVTKASINHILSNSFGFGGANSALIISKV